MVTAWRFNVAADEWIQVRQKVTGPDGTYSLFVPEGTYRVEFIHGLSRYQSVFYGGAQTVDDATDDLDKIVLAVDKNIPRARLRARYGQGVRAEEGRTKPTGEC